MPEHDKFDQNIVSLGGGTGHFTYLRGVVKINNPQKNIAITSTWDSGGSSGELRLQEGVLPPGDYMQCLLGLMEDPNQLKAAMLILRDRQGGHPLVNQLAAKSERIYHGVEGGIDGLRALFRVNGKIIPVSLEDADLSAETRDGVQYNHEHSIDSIKNDPDFYLKDIISRIYFDHPLYANPKALEALCQADKIVFPPGSPYTSIFPHLLVEGVAEEILQSKAKLIAVLNLMTTKGEDHHLKTATNWLEVFQYYLGDQDWIKQTGKSRIDFLIVNENHIDPQILDFYKQQGQVPIEVNCEECSEKAPGLQVIRHNLVAYDKKSHLLRHDPDKLAKIILSL